MCVSVSIAVQKTDKYTFQHGVIKTNTNRITEKEEIVVAVRVG